MSRETGSTADRNKSRKSVSWDDNVASPSDCVPDGESSPDLSSSTTTANENEDNDVIVVPTYTTPPSQQGPCLVNNDDCTDNDGSTSIIDV